MMQDDRRFLPDGAQHARHAMRWLTCWLTCWLASGCGEAAPPDDAAVNTLESDEILVLCDELRDAVTATDQPTQCDSGEVSWVVPSNQSCREADRTACTATVGELRACSEWLKNNPCSAVSSAGAGSLYLDGIASNRAFMASAACPFLFGEDGRALESGCEEFIPVLEPAVSYACTPMPQSRLLPYEGVYEVAPYDLPSTLRCDATLPDLIEPGARYLVAASTEATGVPEIVLKSCTTIVDCQALAREIRMLGAPASANPGPYAYNHLVACDEASDSIVPTLDSVSADGVLSCEEVWQPHVAVTLLSEAPSPLWTLSIYVSANAPMTGNSPGCGYIVRRSPREPAVCSSGVEYRAAFVAPL